MSAFHLLEPVLWGRSSGRCGENSQREVLEILGKSSDVEQIERRRRRGRVVTWEGRITLITEFSRTEGGWGRISGLGEDS